MASFTQAPNGTWKVQFVQDRARKTIYLGNVNKGIAKEITARVESLLNAANTGTPIDPPTKEWLSLIGDELASKLHRAGLMPKRESRSLGQFIGEYIKRRESSKPGTLLKYDRIQKDLAAVYGECDLREITVEKAEKLKAHYIEEKYAASTTARRLTFARSMFEEAKRLKLIEENPFATVKSRAIIHEERKVYIPTETVLAVMEVAKGGWKTAIALSRFAGLRAPSEVLLLKWSAIDWKRNRITVTSPKTEHIHGKGTREVPIFPELRPWLEAAMEDEEYTPKGYVLAGEPFTRYRAAQKEEGLWERVNMGTMLRKIIKRAGMVPWVKPFHNMRASCETDLINKFSIHAACAWIGNTPRIALDHYAKVRDEDFDAATTQKTTHANAFSFNQESEKMAENRTNPANLLDNQGDGGTIKWTLRDLLPQRSRLDSTSSPSLGNAENDAHFSSRSPHAYEVEGVVRPPKKA